MVRKILAIKPTVSKQVFIEMQLYRAYFSGGVSIPLGCLSAYNVVFPRRLLNNFYLSKPSRTCTLKHVFFLFKNKFIGTLTVKFYWFLIFVG